MATPDKIALTAHLMRRAGFGVSRDELESLAEQPYEELVEGLVEPGDEPSIDEYTLFRHHPSTESLARDIVNGQMYWLYHMVNSTKPLEEKMTLFWHHVFATGDTKIMNTYEMATQIDLFRRMALGDFRSLLVALGQSPAMIYWLDQNENHKREPNENWGRELIELFSMGVGNYTEDDVKEVARAFTGWTSTTKLRGQPWGPIPWLFRYMPEDHDEGLKSFLGHASNLNGEDIIDIVVRQPATARFIARHLYNFFVADEPQVPAWHFEKARNPEAIETLASTLVSGGLEMKPVLRVLFNSDFFKEALYEKVRNPAEVVAGTLRLVDDMRGPDPRWSELPHQTEYMGQVLMDPPSVEGWHTGREWINSGAFMNRVNFVADRFKDTSLPGVRGIVRRIAESNGAAMTPDDLVDRCLEMVGPLQVEEDTRREILEQVAEDGPVSWASEADYERSSTRVGDVLALIAGTREYQMG